MATQWRAGFQHGTTWIPHPDCPGFANPQDAKIWGAQWMRENSDKPQITVGSWEEKDV